jgi:hypothetical protein
MSGERTHSENGIRNLTGWRARFFAAPIGSAPRSSKTALALGTVGPGHCQKANLLTPVRRAAETKSNTLSSIGTTAGLGHWEVDGTARRNGC